MPRLSKIGAAALAAFGWTSGSAVSASYLVVAGGGSGGQTGGNLYYKMGGGGAGGLLTGTASLNPTLTYTITVGAGGASPVGGSQTGGFNGSNSTFSAITTTVIGGGAGGEQGVVANSGGSGGGSSGSSYSSNLTVAGGAGTSGQGNAGGTGYLTSNTTATYNSGAGGGGAGAVGADGVNNTTGAGGAGGVGVSSSITGTATYYAGGGGGGGYSTGGAGGNGGGGAGGSGTVGSRGAANTGGGGGGGGSSGGTIGGAGGSGVVIISYVGAQQFSGGVVSSSGGNTIHTFTTSGTLGPVTPLSANYLVVAGGAGGGGTGSTYGGGGGAGGFRSFTGLVIDPYSTYLVTVGAGGAAGVNGSDSFFSTITSTGGGRGGEAYAASTGGSGGGGGYNSFPTGAAGNTPSTSPSQGNSGGNGYASVGSPYTGGGGGGAGAAGSTYSGSVGGAGGIGATSSISGTSTYYAGGGGGASGISTGGAGGTGGGGTGSGNGGAINPIAGTANTGGGGGGGGYTAAAGGSGVVIISYAGSTQLMAGGVVTIAGGNVIHTFNSSGYLTPLTLLTRSLRFRSSATAYLSRTYGSSGSTTTATFSAWIKRGQLTSGGSFPIQGYSNGGNQTQQIAYQSDALNFYVYNSGAVCNVSTSAVYRDPAAWYHVVFQLDSTQATSTNRVRIYVNGVQQATTGTQPSQNANLVLSIATQYNIGVIRTNGADGIFDGYMAEVNFIDGQALAPTAFGTVNSYGVWQPITYGGSYGTNGFRLPFTNNASTTTLGYDFSPQGNNWTTNNISVTAGSTYDSMTDVPTLTSATAANFVVLNPLNLSSPAATLANGNLRFVGSTSAGASLAVGTFGISSGKWYFEYTPENSNNQGVGVHPAGVPTFSTIYAYDNLGRKISGGSATAYGATYTTNDVIGVALDMDAGTLAFYKNNTSQGTAFTGLSGTLFPAVLDTDGAASGAGSINFGQQPFTYTPPSGYLALNTFNL